MADADTIWQGNSDVFNGAINWDNGIPGTTAADLIGVFDGSVSQRSPQTNMDQSGAAHAFKIAVRRNFRAQIGSDGNPLVLLPPAGVVSAWFLGSGDVFAKVEGIAVSSDIVIDAGNARVQIDTEDIIGAEIGYLIVKSGRVTIRATASVAVVTLNGPHAEVDILAGGIANAPLMMVEYGKLTNARELNSARMEVVIRAGEIWQTGLLKSTTVAMAGGYFNYNPTSDPAAFTPGLYLFGNAHFDASDYAGAVPLGTVVKGEGAQLSGSIIDQSVASSDFDLSMDFPGG